MQDTSSAHDQAQGTSKPAVSLAPPPLAAKQPGAAAAVPSMAPGPGRPLPVGRMPLSIQVAADEARAHTTSIGAGARAAAWLRGAAGSRAALALARILIASYFLNVAYTSVETWWTFKNDPRQLASLRRWASDPVPQPPPFPWLHAAGLLPAALAAALWPRPPVWAAAVLLAFTVWEDGGIALRQARAVLLHGSRPTELLVQPLAVCGTAALLLAASVRDARRARSASAWAGPPTAGDADEDDLGGGPGACVMAAGGGGGVARGAGQRASARRSALLLAGRVLMALLLAFSGWMQVQRLAAGAAAPPPAAGAAQHYGRSDPHDNPLVLIQCALAALLALGLVTRPAAAALAGALVLEAAACWRFWERGAPNIAYAQHMREHFFVDLGLAGGALLLMALGAGGFAVDAIAAARKRQ